MMIVLHGVAKGTRVDAAAKGVCPKGTVPEFTNLLSERLASLGIMWGGIKGLLKPLNMIVL